MSETTKNIVDLLKNEGIIIERLNNLRINRITLTNPELKQINGKTKQQLDNLLRKPESLKGQRINLDFGEKRYRSTIIMESYKIDNSSVELVTLSGAEITIKTYSQTEYSIPEN